MGTEAVPDEGSAFTASHFETFSVERIIEDNGPRNPGYPDAQTSFRAVFLIIGLVPLGEKDWERWSDDVERFCLPDNDGDDRLFNFWEANGGRARLTMDDLGADLKESMKGPGG